MEKREKNENESIDICFGARSHEVKVAYSRLHITEVKS